MSTLCRAHTSVQDLHREVHPWAHQDRACRKRVPFVTQIEQSSEAKTATGAVASKDLR